MVKNFVHMAPRKVYFKVSEEMLQMENKLPGDGKYDKFVGLTETGILAVANTIEDRTDIFKIFWSQDRGWQSRFMFTIARVLSMIT
jgi:hypothetical protein